MSCIRKVASDGIEWTAELTAKSLAHPSSSSKSNTSFTRVDLPEPDFPIRRIRNVLQPLVTESKKVRRPSSSASDCKLVELPVEDDIVFGLILVYGEDERRRMLPKEVYQTDHLDSSECGGS